MKKLPWVGGVLSGFELVSRRPLAALSWAVAFALVATIMAAFQDWSLGRLPPEGGISEIALKLSLMGLVLNLMVIITVCAAILRAMVRPGEGRGAWPRLGGDELHLLAFLPLLVLPWAVISIPVSLSLYKVLPDRGDLPMKLSMHFAMGVVMLAGARLILAAPMTIAEQRLRLGGALGLSQGLHVRLAVIFVSALVLSAVIEGAGTWVRDAVTSLASGAYAPPAPPEPGVSHTVLVEGSPLGIKATLSRIFGALVRAIAFAVQVAPLGYAFQRLTDDPADRAAVFD
ncbi:MAG: hypothetical protein J7515_08040 [Caulobacter sp.]|nr:hypothetical protein [Caulobacter sp.]